MFTKKDKNQNKSLGATSVVPPVVKPNFTNPKSFQAPGFKTQQLRGGFNPSTFKTQHKG